jgi:hypothetical protein
MADDWVTIYGDGVQKTEPSGTQVILGKAA